jgi:pimeloyl-ACP methyl ester carboxylesterase
MTYFIKNKARMLKIVIFMLICVVFAACSSPSQKFLETAKSYNISPWQINGSPFFHRLYLNQNSINDTQKKVLHVYIDGDGTPWEQNRWVAGDPTSRNTVILQMMNKDNMPAILLGRPCYHGVKDSSCLSKYWTSHRYSKIVVKSMAKALNSWLQQNPYKKLVLIGFSGGGTLAVLIAPYLQKVAGVVTVAANLDVARWSKFHNYLPLDDSLNPINMPPLSQKIKQIHFAGLQDKNVSVEIIKSFFDKQSNAIFIPIAEFNHYCCWVDAWSEILPKIAVD